MKNNIPLKTSRRKFIAGAAISGAVATLELSSLRSYLDHSAEPGKPSRTKGVIIADAELCSGCRSCQAACNAYNEGFVQPDLARLQIIKDYFTGEYLPHPCSQCEYPPCLYSCPTGALQVDTGQEGPEQFSSRLEDLLSGRLSPESVPGTNARVVNERECIGCQQCVEGCSKVFDLSRIRLDSERMIVSKCHLCGGRPQCVRFCPVGALLYSYSEDGVIYGYDGKSRIIWLSNVKPLREDELQGELW